MAFQILPPAPSQPLPPGAITAVTVFALLIVGFLVESYYVSRLTIFSNSIALITFLNTGSRLDWILILYGVLGVGAGLVGLTFYLGQEELPIEYYEATFFTYSSAPIGLFIGLSVLFTTHWVLLLPAVFFGAAINSKLLLMFDEKTVPVDELPLAIPIVKWFLNVYDELYI